MIQVNFSFHFFLLCLPRQQESTFSEISIFKTRYLWYPLSDFKTEFRFVICMKNCTTLVFFFFLILIKKFKILKNWIFFYFRLKLTNKSLNPQLNIVLIHLSSVTISVRYFIVRWDFPQTEWLLQKLKMDVKL